MSARNDAMAYAAWRSKSEGFPWSAYTKDGKRWHAVPADEVPAEATEKVLFEAGKEVR